MSLPFLFQLSTGDQQGRSHPEEGCANDPSGGAHLPRVAPTILEATKGWPRIAGSRGHLGNAGPVARCCQTGRDDGRPVPLQWFDLNRRPTDGSRRDRGEGMAEHFGYDVDRRYLPVLLPFLVRPSKDGVTLTDGGSLIATFGLLQVVTPLSNVVGAHLTQNYRWWTAVGARLSRADDGLTFGTNSHAGVCIHFDQKVPSRLRRSGHSALTVTVADLQGLIAALGGDDDQPGSPSP